VLREPIRLWLHRGILLGHSWEDSTSLFRDDDDQIAHQWLCEHSLTWDRLDDQVLESLLNAYAHRADGAPASPNTFTRKRTVFHALVHFAVRRKRLPTDPFDTTDWKPPRTNKTPEPGRVPSADDVEILLRAVAACRGSGPALVAFYATLFYGGLRIAEARALRVDDLDLPASGWGHITVRRSFTSPGTAHTDDGASGEHRELKWRARGDTRLVPIPETLVRRLQHHLAAFPPVDGWVFTNAKGRFWDNGRISRTWIRAKGRALPPGDPLQNCRPYDLRHGNASMLLNAGVPATDVASRLGHSVDVLQTTYAHLIDRDRPRANELVDKYLARAPRPNRRSANDEEPAPSQPRLSAPALDHTD